MKNIFKKKIFTLLEVMMVTIIILIVAGLGVLSYRQVVENARQRVCALNLKTLEEAIKFYSLEEDKLPATLGELKLRHLRKAYAEVMREGNFLLNKLAFFIVKINNPSLAYGKLVKDEDEEEEEKKEKGKKGFLTPQSLEEYGVTEEVFYCPDDPSGNVSYAINQNLAGKKWEDIAPGTPLVVCTSCPIKGKNGGNLFNPSGSGVCGRHFKNLGFTKDVAEAVLKGKMIVKEKTGNLVATFTNINNKCIASLWKNCTVTCAEKPGLCMVVCRKQNNKNLSTLIKCIEAEID